MSTSGKAFLARLSGKFRATVVGPSNQTVSIDRFASSAKYWTNLTSFTLSGSGTYNYTNNSATNAYELYRSQIGSLKSCNAVGYADVAMPAGYSMIANSFNAVDNRVNGVCQACRMAPNCTSLTTSPTNTTR